MLDRFITPLIHPAVEAIATRLARLGVRADHLTFTAFGIGIVAMVCITLQVYIAGAILIVVSRLCDALDGAVARQTEATETLLFFMAMCIWPHHFAPLAYAFAFICAITAFTRIVGGYQTLKN